MQNDRNGNTSGKGDSPNAETRIISYDELMTAAPLAIANAVGEEKDQLLKLIEKIQNAKRRLTEAKKNPELPANKRIIEDSVADFKCIDTNGETFYVSIHLG